tara:strand:- start:924 stop:1961 length:1038 start_codon:yes stop_codon:yes gene_type:complete
MWQTLLEKVKADALKTITTEKEKIEREEQAKVQRNKEEKVGKKLAAQEEEKSKRENTRAKNREEDQKTGKRMRRRNEDEDLRNVGVASTGEDFTGINYGNGNNDMYGMARKQPGTVGTCYVNGLAYYHPACVNIRREERNNKPESNATMNNQTNGTAAVQGRRQYANGNDNEYQLNQRRYLNTAKEKEQKKIQKRLDRINTNNMFSYCPAAIDPCKWFSVAWEIPVGPRPIGNTLIILLTVGWSIFTILLWMWCPTIARAILKHIMSCVNALKSTTENYKNTSNQTKCGNLKQLFLLKIKDYGEVGVKCCVHIHRHILLCGAKIGCIDSKLIPSILGWNEEDSDS